MRILIVSNSYKVIKGGIEHHAAILQEELSKFGHEVSSIHYNFHKVSQELRLHSYDWILFEGLDRKVLLQLVLGQLRTSCKIALFTHGSFMDEVHWKVLVRAGYWRNLKLPFRILFDRVLMRWLMNSINKVICLSQTEAAEICDYIGVDRSRTVGIQPFFGQTVTTTRSASEMHPVYHQPFLLAVARLSFEKNILSLIHALNGLDVGLVLAGQDRGELKRIRAAVEKNNLKHFNYIGPITAKTRDLLIHDSAGCVLPSFIDAFPLFALEALKGGRPVLLSECSYIEPHQGITFTGPKPDQIRKGVLRILSEHQAVDQTWIIENQQVCAEIISTLETNATSTTR